MNAQTRKALAEIAHELDRLRRRLHRLAKGRTAMPKNRRVPPGKFPPGSVSTIMRRPELRAFVDEQLREGKTLSAVRAACAERFANPPSRSAIGRYRQSFFVQHDDDE